MRRSRRQACLFAVGAALVALPVVPSPATAAPKPPLTDVTCDTGPFEVTRSIRVDNDLTDCPGAALKVMRANVTIDLNGHTLDGDDTSDPNDLDYEAGVLNEGNFSKVVVKNGTIKQFEIGIIVPGPPDDNSPVAVSNRIDRVNLSENDSFGIIVIADKSTISNSVAVSNDEEGIQIFGEKVKLLNNVATGNGESGMHFGSFKGVAAGNASSGNGRDGLVVSGGKNIVKGNSVGGNESRGLSVLGDDHRVTANIATDNGQVGILVRDQSGDATSDRNVLTSNQAHGNGFPPDLGDDDDNGLGILDEGVGTKANKNRAFGNDDPDECESLTPDPTLHLCN